MATWLLPTTSGGWKAEAVVAQSAAAAAAFVGDLTIVEDRAVSWPEGVNREKRALEADKALQSSY